MGILLIIGLLTPLAALVARDLLDQCHPIADAWLPGYSTDLFPGGQCLALIALATTNAGRYAGLEFSLGLVAEQEG